jgi:hypothetical protein
LDLKGRKKDHGENCIMMNFAACILHVITVRVIKSRRMRWAGHVARMGEGRGVYRVLVESPEARDYWQDIRVGGRITLRLTLGTQEWMGRTGFGWLRIGSSGGFL